MRHLLSNPNAFDRKLVLYLPRSVPWMLETPALLFDPYETENADAEPEFALERGLQRVLGVDVVRDVRANAVEQLPSAPLEVVLRALRHYFERDAFIGLQASSE